MHTTHRKAWSRSRPWIEKVRCNNSTVWDLFTMYLKRKEEFQVMYIHTSIQTPHRAFLLSLSGYLWDEAQGTRNELGLSVYNEEKVPWVVWSHHIHSMLILKRIYYWLAIILHKSGHVIYVCARRTIWLSNEDQERIRMMMAWNDESYDDSIIPFPSC